MKEACGSCDALAGEVLTPIGDGARMLCYVCAHDVAIHGAELGDIRAGCDCTRAEIYPADFLATLDRELALINGVVPEPEPYVVPPAFVGRHSDRHRAARVARVEAKRPRPTVAAWKALLKADAAARARSNGAGEHAMDFEPAASVEPDSNRVDRVVLIGNEHELGRA